MTFVGILSELLPSGVLPQMANGLGVAETQVGFLVGVHALASAVCAIPLVSAPLAVNRKRLLMALLIGFAVSNIVVAVSSSYSVLVACRILGGICAGVMWPMIAAYGTRLVPEDMQGKAITVIMAGNTLGISIGMPMSFDELDRCLDLITYNGAKTLNVQDRYGIEAGKPANFLVLDADSPFEAVRQRADVLASIRNGEYLFKRPEPSYEVELDVFRKTK